jgi:hypothetical protein
MLTGEQGANGGIRIYLAKFFLGQDILHVKKKNPVSKKFWLVYSIPD